LIPSCSKISWTASATSGSSRGRSCGPPLHDRHLAAEPPERLRELDADIAAAEHHEVGRKVVELQRLHMGERRACPETRDVGDAGAGAEVEEDPLAGDAPGTALGEPDFNGAWRGESAFAEDELHARRGKALAMDLDHAFDHLALAPANVLHPGGGRHGAGAVIGGVPDQLRHPGTLDDILARQAGDVGTGAADQPTLDHHHRATLLRQLPGDVLARLPAAEDDVFDLIGAVHDGPLRVRCTLPGCFLVQRWQ
jgi:hypothetical protein